MERIHRRLDDTHLRLLALIEPLDAEKFARKPAPDVWSVAEVVHHLCLVEQHMIRSIEQELTQPPKRLPLLNHLIPYSLLVARRVRRVRAPKAVEPLNPPPKEIVIDNYNRVRATIKTLSTEHGRKRLSQVVLQHPFLGAFSGVKAVAFVGYHEQRHYKQLQEIIDKLK